MIVSHNNAIFNSTIFKTTKDGSLTNIFKELEKINGELKTTGERIDELKGKGNLTFTEQDELEKLIKTNDELERKAYLLEQANKEAEKEVVTEAQNTYDKYINNRKSGAVGQIDFYSRNSSLLNVSGWSSYKDDLPWLVAQYRNQVEYLENAQANGWTNLEEQARSKLELLEGYISEASLDYQDLYDKIGGISEYSMTDELKVAKQDLNDILDIAAEILGYGGQRSKTTFDDIWNSEGFLQYRTELETLAKEGNLNASVLESNENYKKLLEDIGATAESTSQHINACQSAFNNLVTEWIASTKLLDNVTEENEELTASMLKQMGVANAETIVNEKLTRGAKELAGAQDELIKIKGDAEASSIDLENSTLEELFALYKEGKEVGITCDSLYAYMQQKIATNKITIATNGDQDALVGLCESLGIASEALKTYYFLKDKLAIAQSIVDLNPNTEFGQATKAAIEKQIEEEMLKMQQAVTDSYNVNYRNSINYDGGSSASGSSSSKETKETFDWIETILSRIQKTISNLGKTVSATWKSWTERNNALIDQISNVNRELDLQQQARARYEQQANSVNLDETTKRLVREGAIDITTVDDKTADLLETRGYIASKSIYNSLIQNNQNKKGILQSQRNALMDNLNTSGIEKGTEQWNKMCLEILDLDEEMLKLDNDTAEYQNSLRELDWEVFDIIQEKISGITDETEFLIDLMSNDKMFNEDGSTTDQGQATLGLHAMNYNTYMEQAADYAKEMQKIDKELANNPNNKKLQERKEDLLELWRESVLAAEDEQQSIKDLVSEGYDTLLDSMSKIIDKRKDMLSQVKDLYDYEKSIAQQTAEVSKYQKIINSMQGMADTKESKNTSTPTIKLKTIM